MRAWLLRQWGEAPGVCYALYKSDAEMPLLLKNWPCNEMTDKWANLYMLALKEITEPARPHGFWAMGESQRRQIAVLLLNISQGCSLPHKVSYDMKQQIISTVHQLHMWGGFRSASGVVDPVGFMETSAARGNLMYLAQSSSYVWKPARVGTASRGGGSCKACTLFLVLRALLLPMVQRRWALFLRNAWESVWTRVLRWEDRGRSRWAGGLHVRSATQERQNGVVLWRWLN